MMLQNDVDYVNIKDIISVLKELSFQTQMVE